MNAAEEAEADIISVIQAELATVSDPEQLTSIILSACEGILTVGNLDGENHKQFVLDMVLWTLLSFKDGLYESTIETYNDMAHEDAAPYWSFGVPSSLAVEE